MIAEMISWSAYVLGLASWGFLFWIFISEMEMRLWASPILKGALAINGTIWLTLSAGIEAALL